MFFDISGLQQCSVGANFLPSFHRPFSFQHQAITADGRHEASLRNRDCAQPTLQPRRSPLAMLVASSVDDIRKLDPKRDQLKRLERLHLAARTLGAERRMGQRFPFTGHAVLHVDNQQHDALGIDLGRRGAMLERPGGLADVGNSDVLVAIDGLGIMPARVVALDDTTVSIAFSTVQARDVNARLEALVIFLELMNAKMIETAVRCARQIADVFHLALEDATVSAEDLFSSDLMAIAGTDPQQYDHPAGDVFAKVLPPILARFCGGAPHVVYAVAADRNCYVPVHNEGFSNPQHPGEMRFNALFARNKRVYPDRWTLRAARFSKHPVVQAYRRELPGGFGSIVREASAPITVLNRRWGAAQIAFTMDDPA